MKSSGGRGVATRGGGVAGVTLRGGRREFDGGRSFSASAEVLPDSRLAWRTRALDEFRSMTPL